MIRDIRMSIIKLIIGELETIILPGMGIKPFIVRVHITDIEVIDTTGMAGKPSRSIL